jgi:predicted extracellular nuclease
MNHAARARLALAVTCAAALLALAGSAGGAVPNGPSPDLVVSQIYGGGGNAEATYSHDYIEIFNRGTSTVVLDGKSLQYASATGAGVFGANSGQLTELSGSLAPGRYLLVREATNNPAVGEPLPTPYLEDATPINMSGSAGKVVIANGTTSLGCNTAASCQANGNDTRIIDLIGYGGANYFEGAAAPGLTNQTANFRAEGGCQDSDSNASDFGATTPAPRTADTPTRVCSPDSAPFVAATTPPDGATEVPTETDVTVTFSELVTATAAAFSLECTTSGVVSLAVTPSGPSTTYVLDPQSELQLNETCTVGVESTEVTDADDVDPPDTMGADDSFSFSTTGLSLRVHEIQGAAHLSPHDGSLVSQVPGVVTALGPNGFYMQDPGPDAEPSTSEGIFVFTVSAPSVVVGHAVTVSGRVQEFRPGCFPSCLPTSSAFANLTTTEIVTPTVVSSGPVAPIAPTVVGLGGRVPPSEVIEDDSDGNVETSNTFDVSSDGIDFHESLEGMLVQVNNAVAVGPTNGFGEIPVVADFGAGAGIRTNRGGVVIRPDDFNPERIILDDLHRAVPLVDVRDRFETVRAVVDYNFGNFKYLVQNELAAVDGGLTREVTEAPHPHELAIATFNVENLDPTDPPAKFAALAGLIVDNLRSPDLLAIQEVQDNSGPAPDPSTEANRTWELLIEAIADAGGPSYDYRQIDPLFNQDGGEPSGNIRQGFLFRIDRGLEFVDRPGGTAVTPNEVVDAGGEPQLLYSPGRIDPTNAAFTASRKPLAGEFRWRGRTFFAIANHFNSKGGDHPLFGRFQPPVRSTEVQRHQQAAIVNAFVDDLLEVDRHARIVVLGDINDFEFSETVEILSGGALVSLIDTLPKPERYSYVFEGNSQVLDQILASAKMFNSFRAYDSVHVNSEFHDQDSDHEPQVARFKVGGDGEDDD